MWGFCLLLLVRTTCIQCLCTHLWVVPFPWGLLGRQWGLWWGRYPYWATLVHSITRWHHWLLHHGMHKWWALHTASRRSEVRQLWLMGRTNCPQRRWKLFGNNIDYFVHVWNLYTCSNIILIYYNKSYCTSFQDFAMFN